jgi:hypothetical protein
LLSIADLVAYRLRVDVLVERVAQTAFGAFTAVGCRSPLDKDEHLALARVMWAYLPPDIPHCR